MLTGLSHREFCIRLADSTLLQWFLRISRIDGVSCLVVQQIICKLGFV